MGEFVRLEVDDGIGTIRLDRPPMNALNTQVQEELRAAARKATERADVRAVVLYGGPKVFAAGADIKEMARQGYAEMAERAGALSSAFTRRRADPQAGRRGRSRATRSAAGASWRSPPTSGSPATTPSSASPRSGWASSPARAAPSGWRGSSVRPRPRT